MTHLLLVLGLVVLVINLLSDEVQSKEEQQVPTRRPWCVPPDPTSRWPTNRHRVAKIGQIGGRLFCHTPAMTTKTISEYLEDERLKTKGDLLRTEAEAARIQPLRHGHHRTTKQPELELPAPIEATPKKRKTATAARKKPRATRKTLTKARKTA